VPWFLLFIKDVRFFVSLVPFFDLKETGKVLFRVPALFSSHLELLFAAYEMVLEPGVEIYRDLPSCEDM